MIYKTITQNEEDDIIINFLKSQELDHLLHKINHDRYKRIADDDSILDNEFRDKIKISAKEEYLAMITIESIIRNSIEQIPNEKRIKKSLKRLLAMYKKAK